MSKKSKKSLFFVLIARFLNNKFAVIITFILVISIFLRFYDFSNRWGIGNDSARDMAIAMEALDRGEWPMIGSFSSAGPFVFGPIFYHVLMFSYILFPSFFLAPIVVTAFFGVLTVVIFILLGYHVGGRKLAIILGLLAATSPQLVVRSLLLGQHTYVAISAALVFLFFILFWKKNKNIYAFLMGLSLGAAISFHWQALNLLPFFITLFFVPTISIQHKVRAVFLMTVGILIPLIPLIYWDIHQDWANVRNIMDYFLIGQHRLYVPNSWRLFIFNYLPGYWSFVVGGFAGIDGYKWVSVVIMFFTLITVGLAVVRKKMSLFLVVLSSIFFLLLFVNRFYKGERSEGYLIYFLPFILLFSAWAFEKVISFSVNKTYLTLLIRSLGYVGLGVILLGNSLHAYKSITTYNFVPQLKEVMQVLEKKYPNAQFHIYDFMGRSSTFSQPLSLYLKEEGKTSPDGVPIGFICGIKDCDSQKLPEIATIYGQLIVDMSMVKDPDNSESKWIGVNQEDMYDDLIGWSQRYELTSTFSLPAYIYSKFNN